MRVLLTELHDWRICCLYLCVFISSCANFSVQPADGPDSPGLHFFLPKPYILFWWERSITVKSGTVLSSVVPRFQVIYLPDRSQRYTVKQHALLAKGDFAYTLRDGWRLDAINGEVDTTEFLRLLAETGTTALEKAVPRAAPPPIPETEELPSPVLYELQWNEEHGTYTFRPVPLPGIGLPPPAKD
jgi:hypothetical protein